MISPRFLAISLAALLWSSAALADDKPAGCLYVEVATVPVKYAGPGLVPTIPGTVNGKPVRMLMDTGSEISAMTMRLAEKLDLNMQSTGRWLTGVSGDSRLYDARINEMTVGPTRAGPSTLRVIGTTADIPSYDVIVGAPFLQQADLEINLAARELKFFRPQNCKDSFLAYWTGMHVTEIPYEWRTTKGPNPHFKVELNGVYMDAMIDSGASNTVIELDAARKAGLKLDAPDVKRLGEASGIGGSRIEYWSAHFDKLAIGDEAIVDARIGVMDSKSDRSFDILLGRDFLRTHRVLFAKSQKKLYISYLGDKAGDVFVSHATTIEPWIQREADEGNPDAEFLLASFYRTGTNVPADLQKAARWMEKAASHGHPAAELTVGRRLMQRGRDAEAAPLLRAALDQLPENGQAALWLYIARLRAHQGALAQQELAAAAKGYKNWPAPVAQYYLGQIDAATLFAQATGKTPELTARRVCDSTAAIADLLAAQGKPDEAQATLAAHAECKLPPRPALIAAAGADLPR
jgi:predicted aspartyl protease